MNIHNRFIHMCTIIPIGGTIIVMLNSVHNTHAMATTAQWRLEGRDQPENQSIQFNKFENKHDLLGGSSHES